MSSNHLVDIASLFATGTTPMTHVLNYTISSSPLYLNQTRKIMRILTTNIRNSTNVLRVEVIPNLLVPISVTWNMQSDSDICAYYYSDAGYTYNDNAIQKHTRTLLEYFVTQIYLEYPEFGTKWGIAFVVSRILEGGGILSAGRWVET